MAEKTLKTRIQEKYDSEAHWSVTTNFVPKDGEIIIYSYDDDYEMPRIKIGDGNTFVNDLPFFYEPPTNQELHIIFINKVPFSINPDSTIYNETGYKNGYRVRSGGAEGESWQAACTGFIPVKGGDIIRISGADFSVASNNNAINSADSTFTNIGQFTMLPAHYGIYSSDYTVYGANSVVEESEGVWKWIVPPVASGVAYIRISGYTNTGGDGEKLIVSVNEDIRYIKLINFTHNGTVYTVEEGMTWYDWANSSYNTAGFTVSSVDIRDSQGRSIYLNGVYQHNTIVIQANAAYISSGSAEPALL